MAHSFRSRFCILAAAICIVGCASHPKDFISNGAGVNLPATDPDHIQVLSSVPRGMIIGTVLVDRAKAHNSAEIIAMAKLRAAAVGGDFIVWEDSLGTLPTATPVPGDPAPTQNYGQLMHATANQDVPGPETMVEKSPQARFTVGIFLPESSGAATR